MSSLVGVFGVEVMVKPLFLFLVVASIIASTAGGGLKRRLEEAAKESNQAHEDAHHSD